MVRCFIGLGSNLDNPAQQLQRALDALRVLPETRLISCSPFYRSTAIGPGRQPDYINAVAELATTLAPESLLDKLQAIETAQLRRRTVRWGPRTLDLDILLYGQQLIDTERLCVPHPRLRERSFVLAPLADIAPDLPLPDGTTVRSLLDCCPRQGLSKLGTTIIREDNS